jgi:hypothetical protein
MWTLWRTRRCDEKKNVEGSRFNWSTVITQDTKLCYSLEIQILQYFKNNFVFRCLRKIAQSAY